MSKPFEKVIAGYGWVTIGARNLTKAEAEVYAKKMIGEMVDGAPLAPGKQFRIVDTRLEPYSDAPNMGRVIAICQEIQRPGPQETK